MNVSRSLLPVLFGLSSLTAVACAPLAGTDESGEDGSHESIAAEEIGGEEIATRLSGSVGTRDLRDGLRGDLPETEGAMAGAITELVVQSDGTETVYEVLSFSFGIESAIPAVSATGAHAGKASLVPLSVSVRPAKPGTASLMSRLATGARLDKMVLRHRSMGTKAGASTDIAEFETAFVSSMTTGIQNGTIDSYGIDVAKVTVKLPGGKAGVSHNVRTNMPEGESLCGSGSTAKLGPYVQADPSWALAKESVRIDAAAVAISNAAFLGAGTGDSGAGKAKLEQIAITGPMEQSGACAFYYAAVTSRVPAVRIDAATSADKFGNANIEQRWEACGAYATQVVFSGGAGQPTQQSIVLTAEGVVRTDYAAGKAASVFGWSFVTNTSIAACSL